MVGLGGVEGGFGGAISGWWRTDLYLYMYVYICTTNDSVQEEEEQRRLAAQREEEEVCDFF